MGGKPRGEDHVRLRVATWGDPRPLQPQGTISGSGTLTVQVAQGELYEAGFTQIILGADTLQLSIAYRTNSGWQARTLNQRGFSPLGG